MASSKWLPHELHLLRNCYTVDGVDWCAAELGRSKISVKRKATELQLWSGVELLFLKEFYAEHGSEWCARELGRADIKEQVSKLGLKLSAASDSFKRFQQKQKRITLQATRPKKGWYFLNNKEVYFRSGWEVVYARYLEQQLLDGKIQLWQYEADTFWFESIKRGVRSYTPDFKVFKLDGTVEYHEVKGFMDSKSKTKLRRMEKYHPDIVMVLVDKAAYKTIVASEAEYPEAKQIDNRM